MLTTALEIIIILGACIGALILGMNMSKNAKNETIKTVFDMQQNYLAVLNDFLQREYLFELHKTLVNKMNTTYAEGQLTGGNIILSDFSDMEKLQKLVSSITVSISYKISKDLINGFYRIYSKRESSLTDYISRWVYFNIRCFVVDFTKRMDDAYKMSEFNKDPNYSMKIINNYVIELECSIYKLNGINSIQEILDINSQEIKPVQVITKESK